MTTHTALSVHPYRPGDRDAVIAIFQGAVRVTAAHDYDEAQIDAWTEVDRDRWTVLRRSRPTWIALVGRSPAGFADLEPDGHLDIMHVDPAHQGTGVAHGL